MAVFPDNFDKNGIRYTLILVVISTLILFGSEFLGISDPLWALISAIVCCELDRNKTKDVIFNRVLSTLAACFIAIVLLMTIGLSYWSIIAGVAVITLFCYYTPFVKNNWRIGSVTGAMILVLGLQQHSINTAETLAVKRALEVISGSILGGVITQIFNFIWKIKKKK